MTLKVLLVDDSKSVLDLYNLGLKNELYEKKTCMNGKDALDLYESWKPDLIIMDIVMPEMTGFAALKEIRNREKNNGRKTAIIMSTALGDKSDILDCARVGIQGYIVKPFKHTELVGKVEGYMAAFNKAKEG